MFSFITLGSPLLIYFILAFILDNKHYLKRGTTYDGPLREPNKNFGYFSDLFISKIKFYFNKIF